MSVLINKTGLINSGEYTGRYVKVQDDTDNTGGYLVLLSKSKDFTSEDGFDDWVESLDDLEGYFDERGWQIIWKIHK